MHRDSCLQRQTRLCSSLPWPFHILCIYCSLTNETPDGVSLPTNRAKKLNTSIFHSYSNAGFTSSQTIHSTLLRARQWPQSHICACVYELLMPWDTWVFAIQALLYIIASLWQAILSVLPPCILPVLNIKAPSFPLGLYMLYSIFPLLYNICFSLFLTLLYDMSALLRKVLFFSVPWMLSWDKYSPGPQLTALDQHISTPTCCALQWNRKGQGLWERTLHNQCGFQAVPLTSVCISVSRTDFVSSPQCSTVNTSRSSSRKYGR